jgi:hypothetical protein
MVVFSCGDIVAPAKAIADCAKSAALARKACWTARRRQRHRHLATCRRASSSSPSSRRVHLAGADVREPDQRRMQRSLA